LRKILTPQTQRRCHYWVVPHIQTGLIQLGLIFYEFSNQVTIRSPAQTKRGLSWIERKTLMNEIKSTWSDSYVFLSDVLLLTKNLLLIYLGSFYANSLSKSSWDSRWVSLRHSCGKDIVRMARPEATILFPARLHPVPSEQRLRNERLCTYLSLPNSIVPHFVTWEKFWFCVANNLWCVGWCVYSDH